MKKHILVYSQYFYPEQFRINDICLEMVNSGYHVTVVTGIPNYPEGDFYEGYDWKLNRKEVWKGITIIRVPIFPRKKNKISLIINYLSFVLGARLSEKHILGKPDLVFTYEVSPMTQALPAIWFAKKNNLKHLLYVLDLWPENVTGVTNIKNKLIITPIDRMVDYIYNNSTKILASSKSFVDSISSRGIPTSKLEYWPQYAEDLYAVKNKDNNEIITQEFTERTFVFAGNIGKAQGIDILIKASEILKKERVKVKFIIIGDGREKEDLIREIEKLKVTEYFNFISRKPASQIPYYLAKYDIALITLTKNKIFDKTIPAKMQSLMACGKPILVSANGECQDIIRESNAGLCSNAGDVDSFVKNIKIMINYSEKELQQLANNSIEYYDENFNKKNLLDQLYSWIEE